MPAQPALKQKQYTFKEYVELEEQSGLRHEYVHGEVFAMASGSLNHSDIADNFHDLIRNHFRSKGCRSFQENAKLQLEDGTRYLYPDVVLTCHPEDSDATYFVQHPILIAEVLSPATEKDDRGRKWRLYRKISSLRYYLLVSQQQPYVELYSRKHATALFQLQDFSKLEDIIHFPDLDFSVSLQQMYNGIRFPIAENDTDQPLL
jgi:Uma2 family endonuclease